MMTKNLLFKTMVFGAAGIIFLTMKSDINGKFNAGTSCGTCHGSQATATTVAINGLPTTFVPGNTYPLTFTVTNSAMPKAGFNIAVSGGTFTAGTGSKVNTGKTQITHSAPMAAVSGVSTFSFSWTAPATIAAVTFSAAGNAVNGDGNDTNADKWNATTATVTGAFPASVSDNNKNNLNLYPNPTNGLLQINGIDGDVKNLQIYSINGQQIPVNFTQNNNTLTINASQLATGMYGLRAIINGEIKSATFYKN